MVPNVIPRFNIYWVSPLENELLEDKDFSMQTPASATNEKEEEDEEEEEQEEERIC